MRQRNKSLTDCVMKVSSALFKGIVRTIARRSAACGGFEGGIKNERQCWYRVSQDGAFHRFEDIGRDAAFDTLIHARGIRKAITDHPFSLSQCRPYQFFQMVTAGGIHQQGFAHWRPVRASGRMQCKFANSFCQWSAAGLARCDDVKALSPQALCQSVLKRGLACTFTAFERNESEGRDLSHHCRRSSG